MVCILCKFSGARLEKNDEAKIIEEVGLCRLNRMQS